MIAVKPDDMIIAEVGTNKVRTLRRLTKVTEVGKTTFKATHLIDHQTPEVATYTFDKVVCNLGPNPPTGWVYGIQVSALMKVETVELDEGLDISMVWHIPFDKTMKAMIVSCLKKYRPIFNLVPFSIHVKGAQGKLLGTWGQYKNSTRASVMTLHIPAFKDQTTLDETMTHEVGHGIWNQLVQADIMAEMIAHYGASANITRTDRKQIRAVAAKFDEFDGTPWKFSQTLQKGTERKTFQRMILWIKDVHHLTKEDLVKLRKGGLKTVNYFPDHEIVTGTMMPVVSDYATTKAVEFFCEAWAYYQTGKKIPSAVRTTLENLEKLLLSA